MWFSWRKIFKLEEHLDRFFDSIRAARLETRLSKDAWASVILETFIQFSRRWRIALSLQEGCTRVL